MKWPEITEETPLEEVKRIHQQIWDYVIEHGEKPITPYVSNCAACQHNILHSRYCRDCPIIWPRDIDGLRLCFNNKHHPGLFYKWSHAEGNEKVELAHQIRDLPWKFESEEDS